MKKICFALIAILAIAFAAQQAQAAVCMVPVGGIPSQDSDCDGVADIHDNCIDDLNCDQADWDNNGVGDACQDFIDQDGVVDAEYIQDENINHVDYCDSEAVIINRDNCPIDHNPPDVNGVQPDQDGDGVGDMCDDGDNDEHMDIDDNCPDVANTDQDDYDLDEVGDACDNCILIYNPRENGVQPDENNDGIGDACTDIDMDNDGHVDTEDNCPPIDEPYEQYYNPGQDDFDHDGIGDVCDNCREDINPNQEDGDEDGVGDACTPLPAPPPAPPAADPVENPSFPVGEVISGSGSFTKNNCHLATGVGASAGSFLGMLCLVIALTPIALRRRKK